MITRNPARELGLQDRMGTIEVGKDADLAIFNAHPFNTFARCEYTIIEGEFYYARKHAPTVMTETMQKRSATPRTFSFPTPASRKQQVDLTAAKNNRYALHGGTIHPVDGEPILNGTVVIADGKIVSIQLGNNIPPGTKAISIKGLHLYPGLIDAGTTLGLTEIKQIGVTSDFSESGQFQPDLRAGVRVEPGFRIDSRRPRGRHY